MAVLLTWLASIASSSRRGPMPQAQSTGSIIIEKPDFLFNRHDSTNFPGQSTSRIFAIKYATGLTHNLKGDNSGLGQPRVNPWLP